MFWTFYAHSILRYPVVPHSILEVPPPAVKTIFLGLWGIQQYPADSLQGTHTFGMASCLTSSLMMCLKLLGFFFFLKSRAQRRLQNYPPNILQFCQEIFVSVPNHN